MSILDYMRVTSQFRKKKYRNNIRIKWRKKFRLHALSLETIGCWYCVRGSKEYKALKIIGTSALIVEKVRCLIEKAIKIGAVCKNENIGQSSS